MRVRVRVRVRARVCVRVCSCACACACVRALGLGGVRGSGGSFKMQEVAKMDVFRRMLGQQTAQPAAARLPNAPPRPTLPSFLTQA